jgi:hypothetical protein
MSSNQHTPYQTGMALTASNLEAPLGQLDAAISAVVANGAGFSTTTNNTASAGQKVVPVASTKTFSNVDVVAGTVIWIGSPGGTYESFIVASIVANVSITSTTNLVNTYGSGTIVSASPPELVDARGGYATLGARLNAQGFRKVVALTNPAIVTYTPTTGVTQLFVECIGAGGAGGSAATAATNAAAAGGGGSGAYSAVWVTGAAVKGVFTVAVGTGGAPGAAGANPGGAGGDTTFDTGPSICVAKGGSGGAADTVAAGPRIAGLGGAGGASASGVGDVMAAGEDGGAGLALAAAQALSGTGGGSEIGGEVSGVKATGAGTTGHKYGGGGSGACILSGGASQQGGAGANGLIRIWEF